MNITRKIETLEAMQSAVAMVLAQLIFENRHITAFPQKLESILGGARDRMISTLASDAKIADFEEISAEFIRIATPPSAANPHADASQ